MLESQQRGEEFFAALEGEGGLTEQQAEQRIAAVRGASATLLDRAEDLDAPGQMRDAHSAITQALKLRRDALEKIAENIGQATADTERADSIDTVTTQMGSLYASDILWSQLAMPEMESVIESEGVDASDLPPGNFMPEDDPTEFLDQTSVTELLNNLSGEEVTAGVHGLELVQVDMGDVTLSPDSTTTVDSAANEVSVQVQNGGDSEESGVGRHDHLQRRRGDEGDRLDRGRRHRDREHPARHAAAAGHRDHPRGPGRARARRGGPDQQRGLLHDRVRHRLGRCRGGS